ncbi:MAG: zinc-dependent metalloprotease [Fimbriimonadaceae bacterium]
MTSWKHRNSWFRTLCSARSDSSGMNRISGAQGRVVNGFLSDSRLGRMLDNELMSGSKAYTVREMMSDIRANIWRELGTANPVIGQYRQNAQRSWVTALISKLPSDSSTVRAYALAELRESLSAINGAMPKTKEMVTKQHLSDLKLMIEHAFSFPPASPAAAGGAITFPFGARVVKTGSGHDGCGICQATGKG